MICIFFINSNFLEHEENRAQSKVENVHRTLTTGPLSVLLATLLNVLYLSFCSETKKRREINNSCFK